MTEALTRPDLPLPRAIALTLVSGVLAGLSQPLVIESLRATPVDGTGLTGLLAFIALVPHFVAIRDASVKRTYWLSFLLLVVWFSIVLYWLVVAMHVFGKIPLPIAILCLTLLTSTIGFGVGAAFAVAKLIARHYMLPFWGVLPFALAGAEHIRNHGPLGGFPWGNLGQSLATVPVMLQSASVVGVYGLVLLLMFVNTAIGEAWAKRRTPRRVRRPLIVAGAIVVAMTGYGAARLAIAPDVERTVKVGLLQGNIEQGIKNQESMNRRYILERYHALQREAVSAGADIVVWPEAALPIGLRDTTTRLRGSPVHDATDERLPPAGIFGATVVETRVDPATEKKSTLRYNSAVVADGPDLTVRGRFDKVHLVPFGEYVPWPFDVAVRHIVPGGTARGAGFVPVEIVAGAAPLSVGTTVCYEGVFPEISRAFANDGARLMFNVTNDAWYGVSSASYQHTLMYAMRAVETARPVARVANTGVSAFIDTRGRVTDMTELYETKVVVGDVAITDEWTPYLTLGDVIPFLSAVGILALWFYALLGPGYSRRPRRRLESVIGYTGLVVMAGTLAVHFVIAPPGIDEMLSTRNQLIFIGAALVGLGALSGRPWGRTAQRWVGGLSFVLCATGPFFGAPITLVPSIAGLVIAVLAHRRPAEYVRPAERMAMLRRE